MPGFQIIDQMDFSGGVNSVTNPSKLTEKQVSRIRNLLFDEHTALRTRDGFAIVTTSPDLVNPILYVSVLNQTSGASTPYAIQGDGINPPTLYRTDTTPWTSQTAIAGFNTGFTIPQAITVIDEDIIANGYEVPKIFTGAVGLVPITASGGQSVPAGAKHIAFHLGSVWVWNTSGSTTALDGPSSLRMSDANNPNSWPNANQTFISKDDGQVGMGLATFTIAETGISPTQTLVCFKNYSGYQVIGVFGATNFSIQKIKSDMGCVAPRSIQFVSGFGIIRLSHKGFALFDGVDDKIISEEIRPYLFGRDDISGINFGNAIVSWASQSQNPPLYICACPIGGTGLSRVFVYDLVRKAWSICDFPTIALGCLNLITTPTSVPTIHAGTATGGQRVRLFSGDPTDNGVDIPWSFRTKTFFQKNPTTPTYWRRLLIEAAVVSNQVVTIQTTLNNPFSTLSNTVTFKTTGSSSIWGTGVWGVFVWGGTPTDDVRDIDILRKARSIQFDINGAGVIRIRSLQLQTVPQPPTIGNR
jgi:hypothetical protein